MQIAQPGASFMLVKLYEIHLYVNNHSDKSHQRIFNYSGRRIASKSYMVYYELQKLYALL